MGRRRSQLAKGWTNGRYVGLIMGDYVDDHPEVEYSAQGKKIAKLHPANGFQHEVHRTREESQRFWEDFERNVTNN